MKKILVSEREPPLSPPIFLSLSHLGCTIETEATLTTVVTVTPALRPSAVKSVITVPEPLSTAVTSPVPETVASAGFDVVHEMTAEGG